MNRRSGQRKSGAGDRGREGGDGVDGGGRGQEDRLDVVFGRLMASGSQGSAVAAEFHRSFRVHVLSS
jgi:hypothetical protein